MDDDRWHETEWGTVVRRYFHARGAAREMQAAQQEGWNIQEVKINGVVIPEAEQTRWWRRLRGTRLIRASDGTVRLNTSRFPSGVWGHDRSIGKGPDMQVTYVR